MAEYIEREAAMDAIINDCPDLIFYSKREAIECIAAEPAADVAPVVHGRWVKADNLKPKCSVCGEFHLYSWPDHKKCNYCPNCGAKMDLEENE